MTSKTCTRNSVLSVVLSRCVIFAVITLYALSMQCCGVKKVLRENQIVTDSVIEKTEITRELVQIPPARVDLRLPVKDVMKLPPGAVFQKKDKQAAIKIEYRDSIVYITSTCDSLQLIIENKNREIARLRAATNEKQNIEKISNWEHLKNNLFFIVVGILLTYITRVLKNKR
ncbi:MULTISPECIES: hypothetical protein [Butyricimonas]|uniref:hypothetical protein n=1 Tax=Butyricimonas TaxID=574697 RepID=UPI001D081BC7|nr:MULTISPECIES: hypothetical protein [Butyricimonas]MCB6971829.1 hypothetical protein [Butyricimonas synergistica]MCG4518837.1 hypothetical protein [Butyricimonas sp. DFI.6.44]